MIVPTVITSVEYKDPQEILDSLISKFNDFEGEIASDQNIARVQYLNEVINEYMKTNPKVVPTVPRMCLGYKSNIGHRAGRFSSHMHMI
jgi:hypothetical protein